MINGFKLRILFSAFTLLIISPGSSFAWHDYNGGDDWDYHGSGRDNAYSYYIDKRYNPGYADYTLIGPDYIDDNLYIKNVTAPVVIPVAQPDSFTVNIPNKNGGYTAVVLKRSGSGFTGPQGEYYPEFPKVFQLEIMYGK